MIDTEAKPGATAAVASHEPVHPGKSQPIIWLLSDLLRHVWQWRHYVPLTTVGVLVLAAAYGIDRWYGESEADFVLHAAALVAYGLVGFSLLMVSVVTAVLWLRLQGARDDGRGALQLESGLTAATGYTFPRFRMWPLVQVRLTWDEPVRVDIRTERSRDRRLPTAQDSAEARNFRWEEVVLPHLRGRYNCLRRRFLVGDIFGLTSVGLPRRSRRPVRVLPARAQFSATVLTHVVAGDLVANPRGTTEGEMLDVRRYAQGDPLRRVLWKAYARTRQLLVRTPEAAVTPSPSCAAYMVAGPCDEPTASTARFFVENGLLGKDFAFGADGSPEPTNSAEEALEQIIGSVHFRRQGARGLHHFVERIDQRRLASCILFLPPMPGAWVHRVERVAKRLRRATAVVPIDHDVDRRPRGLLYRLLFSADRGERSAVAALPELVRRMKACGFDVRVLHRPTGHMIPTSRLGALTK